MARVSRSRFLDQPCKHIAAALLATTLVLVGSAFVLTNSAQAVTGASTRGRPNESAMTCPIGATCYYFAAGGNDSAGAGTLASPWQSVAKAMSKLASLKPGDELLFKGGDSWTQTFTFGDSPTHAVVGTAAAPIVVGSYGTGRAIFDENNTNGYCFKAIYPSSTVRYVTLNNFECRHATRQAVTFQTSGGKLPGITIENFYIHDTGPGCSSSNGPCLGNDPGGYLNQLDFQDTGFSSGSSAVNNDGVHFLNNVMQWTGGHNCVQVHYDTGAVLVQANTVGPGCVHGFFDLKGPGSSTNQAIIKGNICYGGQSAGLAGTSRTPCYYTENTVNPHTNMLWQSNVAMDTYVGLEICPGGVLSRYTAGGLYKIYNNTFYARASSSGNSLVYLGNQTCNGTNGGRLNNYTLDVRNNIFDGGASNAYTLALVSSGGAYSPCTENYNNIGGSQGKKAYTSCWGNRNLASKDQNSVNPVYVNAAGANFGLQAGSPELNSGYWGLTSGNNNIGAF